MKYSFDVMLEENDYYEFNKFWMLKSHYGKRNILSIRVMIGVMILAVMAFSLFLGKFTAAAFLGMIPFAVILVVVQLLINPFFAMMLKSQMKQMKKSGKMPFSAVSLIAFYEDRFEENTAEGKAEHPYTALERVSAVEGKMVYLHINNVMAYLIPYKSFADGAQYEEFLAFLSQKCEKIDRYKK
ncbi:MAG: YcxB family protein [Ruminococcaceae bacterium]|nr:YcxB family protein [Oscillospiraceae bacterium]